MKTPNDMEAMIIDDMEFIPYMDDGYQCKMNTERGLISVRYKGRNLFTSPDRPYEVWYPTENEPTGNQTADDIWNYIKNL